MEVEVEVEVLGDAVVAAGDGEGVVVAAVAGGEAEAVVEGARLGEACAAVKDHS